MTRKEEICDVTKEQFTYVKDENLKSALRFAFIDGAKWADEHPNLASLWHDASEEPRCDELLLGEDTDGFSIYRWCGQEDYWETFVNETGLSRWAYIEDLLPKGGEE